MPGSAGRLRRRLRRLGGGCGRSGAGELRGCIDTHMAASVNWGVLFVGVLIVRVLLFEIMFWIPKGVVVKIMLPLWVPSRMWHLASGGPTMRHDLDNHPCVCMYVCICMHMHVCICMYRQIHVCVYAYTYFHTCTHTMCVWGYTYMSVWLDGRLTVCSPIYLSICLSTYLSIYLSISLFV